MNEITENVWRFLNFFILSIWFLEIFHCDVVIQLQCVYSTGTLTVEQIFQDRDQFAKLVRDVAAPDVGRMGIEILSFTIKVS